MKRRKPKPTYLKLIKGREEGSAPAPAKAGEDGVASRPVYIVLVLLASLLIVQILIGWAWRATVRPPIYTMPISQSTVDVTFSVSGIITFEERVVLAPCAGYIYYKIAEGQRVPLDKVLARITAMPLKKESAINTEEKETGEPLQRFKEWFLGEKKDEEENELASFFPGQDETCILAPNPGLISFNFDGLEEFGPRSKFPYFSEEELQDKIGNDGPPNPGDEIYRFQPLCKIINNYYWYFSVVLPRDLGAVVVDKTKVKLFFPMDPATPVWGEKVEMREREDGSREVTWRIGRELPDLFKWRCCKAEIVYKDLQGVLVPKSALEEFENGQGVYVLEKGTVRYKKVKILLERDEDVLIKNLEDYQRVVTQPAGVYDGQRYSW